MPLPNGNLSTVSIPAIQPVSKTVVFFNYKDWCKRFVEDMQVVETTQKGYEAYLRQFGEWMHNNGINAPTRENVKQYRAYLEEQPLSAGTKSQYIRAVKHFFSWASSEGLYDDIGKNIKGLKVKADNTKKEAFAESDIKAILESIDNTTEIGKRDFAMILLSVVGGLRIIELQRANIEDLQTLRGQRVLFIQGKGRTEKDEYIKIPFEVGAAIDEYLNARKQPVKRNAPLFTGAGRRANGERLTEPSISRVIKTVFKQAGYDSNKLTAHSLRHTSNTMLFKAGADLYTVQQHARHADPKTTEIYLHNNNRDKDQSEQKIYNQIFRNGEKTLDEKAVELFAGFTDAEKQKIIEIMEKMKGGMI